MGNTRKYFTFIALLACAGCARPGPLLEEAGGLVLARGDEAVEVERDAELAIAWTAGGAQYATWARQRDGEKPVTVRLVEANADFVRVRSEAWKSVEHLPWSYLQASGIKVAARSGRYERPTVSIPVEQIDEVQVFARVRWPRGREELSQANVAAGALGGAGGGGLAVGADRHLVSEPDLSDGEIWTDERAFWAVGISAAVGAVAYPAYRALWPRGRSRLAAAYRMDEGWRVEVRR